MVVAEWVERIVDSDGARTITHTDNAPATLGEPIYDAGQRVWRVPVHGAPGTTVDIEVNGALLGVALDASGQGEVVLDATVEATYHVVVVGAPTMANGAPIPPCAVTVTTGGV